MSQIADIYLGHALPPTPFLFSVSDMEFLYQNRFTFGEPRGKGDPFPRLDGRHDVCCGIIRADADRLILHPNERATDVDIEYLVGYAIELIESGDFDLGRFNQRPVWRVLD
ncbi:hypothetical protein [Nocardia wallacei]|uniref:hypothetical protein n=1 Tax=Nocardia wallacei TaxID=480035 RepID=UPI002454223C|nr:hypothetical protein [Nocardia wallacei]